mmetsp:Transcript_3286/g.6423  ORF Transcript_3286/g.6423 Transcript_3286/m.6423 type:complete len:90 (+) Transcript_3286:89-358(+)
MIIIMGTEDYGCPGTVNFSTKEELVFILQEKKPFFLIKMCERFEDSKTRFQLPDDTSYVPWTPGKPVPDDLIGKMLDKYQNLMKVKGTT